MMRKALLIGIFGLALALAAAPPVADLAFAQGGQSGGRGKGKAPPPQQPLPRCADLAVSSLGFTNAIPGAAPLATGELALQYDVHNSGNAPYQTASAAAQTLSLEYLTPGGARQVASQPLPTAGAVAAPGEPLTLAQGQSWRGYMRVTLPPEARGRPLRLRLNFSVIASPFAARPSDCDPGNNETPLPRL